jgi:D-alanyl-D-alanine carboxypeptidase/D-alanyl-D-alanine-endopeptidase (penicillin-binding protein 4)
MLTGKAARGLAAGAVGLLCLAACTGNSSTTGTTASPSSSSGAASSGAAAASVSAQASGSGTAQPAGLEPTYADGKLTSVPGLPQAALDVINQPLYKNGQWAIAVRDIDTGEQLVALNADTFFEPGSVVKTYSTGAAWLELGPDSTVVTPVKRTGEVVDGTLNGDLVLVGKGDVTMGGRTKPDGTVDFANLDHNDANGIPGATLTTEDPLTGLNDLAAQVKASGINSVSGNVIIDDRLWDPHKLANNVVSPIQINQNVIDFTTTPTTPGQLATTEMNQKVAPWEVSGQVQTVAAGEGMNIKVDSLEPGKVVLSGKIAADYGPTVNVYLLTDPATYARTAFIEALGRAGVTVTADPIATNPASALPAKTAVDGLTSVAELTSLPLSEEATYINKISYNNGGETMLCRLAVASGTSDCRKGAAAASDVWRAAGLDTTTAAIVDGSGLVGNVITPNNQVDLQTIMANRPDAEAWKATLPILGVDGSLTTVQANGPAAGKVVGKTGTLVVGDPFNSNPDGSPRFRISVKALGGDIETKSGRNLAFAVFSSNSFAPTVEGVFAANDDVGAIVAAIQQAY